VVSAKTTYHGHKVVRILPQNPVQLKQVQVLLDQYPTADVWRQPSTAGVPVDVQFPPGHSDEATAKLKKMHIKFVVVVQDVQSKIDAHHALNNKHESKTDMFKRYHDFATIIDWVKKKAGECGTRCQIVKFGNSFEGRPLYLIKIGTPGTNKQGIWIDGGIHAREWISPATAMYVIERLIDDYNKDNIVKRLVDTYDWYVAPVLNPDGYNYTWTHDRNWRKTRSTNSTHQCVGVDANRNFDFKWMTIGASQDPCKNTYAGPRPFSEPETAAVAGYIKGLKQKFKIFITLHSYSQLWMAPWGYSMNDPPNYNEMIYAGQVAVNALHKVYGTDYTVGSASEILYRSSGTSRDWAAGALKIPYVYTIELRDTGFHGFLLPPVYIRPTVVETWAGIRALANYVTPKPHHPHVA